MVLRKIPCSNIFLDWNDKLYKFTKTSTIMLETDFKGNFFQTTGVYSWSDGWPVRYTNWGKDEPSKGPTDGCVTIMEDGRWNDTMCEKRLPSICRITTGTSKQSDNHIYV